MTVCFWRKRGLLDSRHLRKPHFDSCFNYRWAKSSREQARKGNFLEIGPPLFFYCLWLFCWTVWKFQRKNVTQTFSYRVGNLKDRLLSIYHVFVFSSPPLSAQGTMSFWMMIFLCCELNIYGIFDYLAYICTGDLTEVHVWYIISRLSKCWYYFPQ